MGSLLSAWLESMGGQLREDDNGGRATLSKETMDAGLNLAVKDNDDLFPPEWRLSRSGRRRPAAELTVAAPEAGAPSRARRGAPAVGVPGGRPLDLDRRRLLHEAAGRRRRRGHQGRVARAATRCGAGRLRARARSRSTTTARSSTSSAPPSAASWSTRTDADGLDVAARPAGLGRRRRLVAGLGRWPRSRRSTPRDSARPIPHLLVTAITPFGLDGPWSDKPATEFTLQAWSGGIVGLARGQPERAARVRRRADRGVARRSLRRHRHAGGSSPPARRAASSSTSPCSRRWRCASPTTR